MLEPASRQEKITVLLVAAVQFINVLDFIMVMPMGPDFAAALGIPSSNLGLISSGYTAAAAVSGLAGSFFLDRFDRRPALGIAMLGLVIGTALGGFATDLSTLIAARVVAGLFGGPATSIALSIIADAVPKERRGSAMGRVMAAFSIASVLGVPAGLELARRLGWRAPFFGVALLGVVIAAAAVFLLPSMRGHLQGKRVVIPFSHLLGQPLVLISWTMTFLVMAGGFILIPNISAYLQENLAYPRARLGLLYLCGGVVSFGTTLLAGRAVDRFGSFRVGSIGTLCLSAAVFAGFFLFPPLLPPLGIFIAFSFSMGLRNVAYNTLTTRVPAPAERARFMSIQSAVTHTATSVGAVLSSRLLTEQADRKLVGMGQIALVSIGLTLTLPFLLYAVESAVRKRDRRAAEALAAVAAPA